MNQPDNPAAPPATAFMLGKWVVDPATSRVSQGKKTIQLEPRVMQLLVYLASQPGHVFSRQDLEAHVWAGSVVSYDAISKAVIKLRKALNDDPAEPRYIETIPRRGYRLIAEVGRPTKRLHQGGTRIRNRSVLAFVVLLAIILSVLSGWQIIRQAQDSGAEFAVKQNDKVSVLVLPLHNIGNSSEDDYFAAGLTSDLVTDLSKISNLVVVANRNYNNSSSHSIAAGSGDAAAIKYILSGDIARDAGQLRVNIRLEDVKSGQYLWTERYQRELADIFKLQNEITTKIVNSLAIKITEQEKRRIAMRYTNNVQAYDYFLKARSYLIRYTEEGNRLARENYLAAIALDQTFARAHAGLALTYALDYRQNWTSDVDQPLQKAQSIVRQIQNMNSELPEVYWILSYIENIQGRFTRGLEYARRSLELEPGYADAYALMTGIYTYLGDYQQAIASMYTALRLNPDGGQLYYLLLGRAQYFAGDFENAVASLREAYDRNPSNRETLVYLIATHVRLGDLDEAEWFRRELQHLSPQFSIERWLQGYPLQDGEKRQQLIADFNPHFSPDGHPAPDNN